MAAPITPHDVEQEILRLSRLLDHATKETARRGRVLARVTIERDQALARAYLDATGTIAEREARRDIACAYELARYEVAKLSYRNVKDASHNIRVQLDSLRSLNANVRHQSR